MDMKRWLKTAPQMHKAMPILSFPGVQLLDENVNALVKSGKLQALCMRAISERYDLLASVSLMDLSVEAEAFGSPIRFSDNEVPTVTKAIIEEGSNPDTLKIPEIGAGRTDEYITAIENAKHLISKTPVFAGSIGPFSLAARLLDMSEIMVMCYTEPELVHAVLEKATAFLIRYNTAFRTAGADGLIMAEPAAGLLSPELINEFSTPYVKKIFAEIKSDEFAVIYHNCGNTIPLIDSILETGADGFHFGNAIDLSEMLPLVPAQYPVFGNISPADQFANGTPDSIKQDTLSLLKKCDKHPNFIISSGCDIPPAAPLANIDSFFAAVEDFYR